MCILRAQRPLRSDPVPKRKAWGRLDLLRPCLQDGARKASCRSGRTLPTARALAGLAQNEKLGAPGGEARGRSGLAYVETDPTKADATTIVRNLLQGQYERPVRVVALNADEGWARDVSENIAAKIREVAQREGRDLTSGTRAFIEAHSQRTIPTFW